ncbi:low molecular weight phosphatase family protein [Rhodohalobacter halophilus]|uniref:protein-tyrosine-phosphatase n=1 Tax=Rhodohalobacter halophilus TaxID=1812810 RepID=UPI00083F93E3|nr:protein-tyrosine-phosphatase [Rhodohalobacter halophilus]
MRFYEPLESTINSLKKDIESIPNDRKKVLEEVSDYVRNQRDSGNRVKLNFICTHNSRRSHLAQIWTSVAAHHFGMDNIETYSGGTEATAFNPRAVAALDRAGFRIENPGGDNPRYKVHFSDEAEPITCFSKTFDDGFNPSENFAAIMTCSDADENCPFIPGAEKRISVPYRDPKESDGTPDESKTYAERSRQIAAEWFYMMSQV